MSIPEIPHLCPPYFFYAPLPSPCPTCVLAQACPTKTLPPPCPTFVGSDILFHFATETRFQDHPILPAAPLRPGRHTHRHLTIYTRGSTQVFAKTPPPGKLALYDLFTDQKFRVGTTHFPARNVNGAALSVPHDPQPIITPIAPSP